MCNLKSVKRKKKKICELTGQNWRNRCKRLNEGIMSTIQSVQRHRKCRAGLWDRQTGRYVVDRDVSRWWRPADLWVPLYLPSGKISSEPASAGTLRWRHSSGEHSSSSGPLRRAVNSWMKTPKRVIAVCPRGMRLTSLWWKEDKSERRGKHCVAVRTPSLTSPHLTSLVSTFPSSLVYHSLLWTQGSWSIVKQMEARTSYPGVWWAVWRGGEWNLMRVPMTPTM